jgi:hypothetical protein
MPVFPGRVVCYRQVPEGSYAGSLYCGDNKHIHNCEFCRNPALFIVGNVRGLAKMNDDRICKTPKAEECTVPQPKLKRNRIMKDG